MANIDSRLINQVLVLTIDRQAQKNAINQQMYTELADQIQNADSDPKVKSIVLTGKGEMFTAGNDVNDFLKLDDSEQSTALHFLDAISTNKTPLIAAVNGPAIGIGLTLLLHCDLVFCARAATFTAPFAKLGLVPEAASSLLLPIAVGKAMANDILLAGRKLNSEEALRCGLVSRVYEDDTLFENTLEVAMQITNMLPDAVMKTKRLVDAVWEEKIKNKMQEEFIDFSAQLQSSDFKQSMQMFLNKKS